MTDYAWPDLLSGIGYQGTGAWHLLPVTRYLLPVPHFPIDAAWPKGVEP